MSLGYIFLQILGISLVWGKVQHAVRTMLTKAITDKQCRYIINQVVLPKIEYLLTDLVVEENEGEKLNVKLRKLFKHKCRFSRTMMDNRQTQMHAKELIHRINRQDLVGDTTKVRLQQLQNKMWDPEIIYNQSVINSMRKSHTKNNLTAKILSLLGKKGITFKQTELEDLLCAPKGDLYDLKHFMGNGAWYNRNRDNLRRRGVMFLEQLLNADLTQNIPWQQIGGSSSTGVQLRWYEEVIEEYKQKKEGLYTQEKINPFNTLREINMNEIKRFQMVVTQKESKLIYGAISRIPKGKERSSLVIQHYIQETLDGEERSPLIPCEGCALRDITPMKDKRVIPKNEHSKCLVKTGMEQSKIIPVRQRIGSTTHKEDRKIKRRLLISPKSIRIYFKAPSVTNTIKSQKDSTVSMMHKHILITESTLDKEIKELQMKVAQYTQINFYTDGSLLTYKEQDNQREGQGETRMGIGVVINPRGYDEGIMKMSARITGPASSTRAELWAILMALEMSPSNSKIKIYTDSASAIAAIKRFMTNRWGKKTKDLKNSNVLQAIANKCNGKRIIFDLVKVEVHAGIFLNERTDFLAKKGAREDQLAEINPRFLQRKINYEWNNMSIDTDIKEFSKREQKINWYVKWRTQYRVVKWCNQHITRETDWKLTQQILQGTKISSRFTNNKDSNDRTFRCKVLNNELPVLRNLHMRKPDLYSSDLCVICSQKKEDMLHPFECKGYDQIIRKKLIQQLAIIGINHGSKKEKSEIVKAFQKESFLKIDIGRQIRGIIESDHFSFVDMLKGLVYKYMGNKIKIIITPDTGKGKKILKQTFNFLKMLMKLKWTERCSLILKWETENKIVDTRNLTINEHYETIKGTLLAKAESIKNEIILWRMFQKMFEESGFEVYKSRELFIIECGAQTEQQKSAKNRRFAVAELTERVRDRY
ncbi:hypothetical protein Glove_36g11 [Diversispora epigaea]|uniref:ribonuclease H n=1 Tax=Diversispora epigaea TaxID=1348612 RepID=A0A397JGI3_9GLOM|nr:hypothetical protein Glove_36g11 [Diversispora epigaea]